MNNNGLKLPGMKESFSYPDLNPSLSGQPLGVIITQFLSVMLFIAGFLSFFWFAWGVFDYIFAGGNKESLGKARKKMTWAIVGFILFVVSFGLIQYAETIFKPQAIQVQDLGIPKTP